MNLRAVRLCALGFVVCLAASNAQSAPNSATISGVVVDSTGTPQMGATVVISPEKILASAPVKLLTNGKGDFATEALPAGFYSVQVTLAGFLPTIEQHIAVSQEHATLLQVVMGSMLNSLGQLREQPEKQGAADDWVWVLRSTANARSVLRWDDSARVALAQADAPGSSNQDHGLVQVSSGGTRPGSVANVPMGPGTTFAYDVSAGEQARLLMAGQYSYLNEASSTGIAAEWLATGDSRTGPVTTMVVRQANGGPGAPVFRGIRVSQDNQLALGDRVSLRYGGEFIYAGLGRATSSVRPRAELAVELAPSWQLSMIVATHPWDDSLGNNTGALESAVNSLDAFPTLMMRGGKPVFENGIHQEIGLKHSLGSSAQLGVAAFHERSTHTAVLGLGVPSGGEYLQGFLGNQFAYDGGGTSSDGARLVYEQRIGGGLRSTVVYDYSGALTADELSGNGRLRELFKTKYRHSLAGRVAATLPVTNTQLVVAYKWINGPVVSQQDSYGEATYGVDPYLSMGVRQPLPTVFPGHMVVQADMGNLLSQGYTSLTASNHPVILVPAYHCFRGGLSFQF